jgi:DNA invertase Pin-like site-specific DNA recombinase
MTNTPEPKHRYDKQRRYRERHRERLREVWRKKAAARGWKKDRDPVKERARHAVRYAVASGKIVKPTHCPRCGTKALLQAHHHNGYDK